MANVMEEMLVRLAAMRANPPSAEAFRSELNAAASHATRVAAVRRTPVRARVRVTQQRAELTFAGPGAERAREEAAARLARTVPEAIERVRLGIQRRLRR